MPTNSVILLCRQVKSTALSLSLIRVTLDPCLSAESPGYAKQFSMVPKLRRAASTLTKLSMVPELRWTTLLNYTLFGPQVTSSHPPLSLGSPGYAEQSITYLLLTFLLLMLEKRPNTTMVINPHSLPNLTVV